MSAKKKGVNKGLLVTVAAAGIGGSAYLLTRTHAQTLTPIISVGNSSPTPNSVQTVSGSGFSPNASISIVTTGADAVTANATTDSTGTFASINLPTGATKVLGAVTVTATNAADATQFATTSYTVATTTGIVTKLTAGAKSPTAVHSTADPLHAKATDASGAGVDAQKVTWWVKTGTLGKFVSIATRPTGTGGVATYPYVVPAIAGTYIYKATCDSVTSTHFTIVVT